MMQWSPEKRWVVGGLGLALMLTGFVSLTSYQNATNLVENTHNLDRAHQVLEALTDIDATLLDAESGRRGYLLSGEPEELKRYNKAIQTMAPKLSTLAQLTASNPQQQQQLAVLKALLAHRLQLFTDSLTLYQKGQSVELIQATQAIARKQNREQIRQVMATLRKHETQLLTMRVKQSQASLHTRMLIEFLGPLLSFALLFKVYALLYRQMLKRQQAEALQQSLAQAKTLGELKLQFFSMVSHEFRTPLSLILGSVQLLLEGQPWDAKPLKHLHRIQAAAKTTSQLLTDLLTLTRAEAGKLRYQPQLLDVESFCLNLLEDLQLCLEPKRLIKFATQGPYRFARLDEQLLHSTLSNLLSNALKYSAPEGTIDFTLSYEAETVVFQIRDEGIGIPLEAQQQLYEPFYRGKNVDRLAGSGLGLAVVKKCVDLQQGQLFVESEVGVGTTFTVKLPCFTTATEALLEHAES